MVMGAAINQKLSSFVHRSEMRHQQKKRKLMRTPDYEKLAMLYFFGLLNSTIKEFL